MRTIFWIAVIASALGLGSWQAYEAWKQHEAAQQRIAADRAARDQRERDLALREEVKAKWGMDPEALLGEIAASFGNARPCPNGWDTQCAEKWRHHAHNLFNNYRLDTSEVNGRIAGPLPCKKQYPLVIQSWPTAELADPVLAFARSMRKNGATRGHWLALVLDLQTLEAAFQIAVREGVVRGDELDALRRAALVQLFKPRAKTVLLMHNAVQVVTLADSHPPTLLSMRHGAGRLVGMSLPLERGFERLKPAILMLEDRTCDLDVSFATQVRVLFDECSPGMFGRTSCKKVYEQLEFTFEGEGELLRLLGAALQPHAPPPMAALPNPAGISPRDLLGAVAFALRIVALVRVGSAILLPRR